ncbi:MAG: protein disulfide oxidoreductase [Campylobacterales bacterium]|nr:protein disulfide oxidoreductase [Campylobacterales bacterium]
MMNAKIKKILKEIVSTLLIVFVLSIAVNYFRAPKLDSNTLPPIETTLIDDTYWSSNDAKKPLVVHFWATWCKVCKLEASNIDALAKEANVITVAVNSGSNQEIQAFMDERKLTYKVLNDPNGALSQKFKIEAFPTTFIFNSKGELSFTETGYTTTAGLKARLALTK